MTPSFVFTVILQYMCAINCRITLGSVGMRMQGKPYINIKQYNTYRPSEHT